MAAGGAAELLIDGRPVMLKPNLINDSPHPVTTPPEFCEAVIAFVRKHTDASIMIAEGCGDAGLDRSAVFARSGYADPAKRLDVQWLIVFAGLAFGCGRFFELTLLFLWDRCP